MKQRDLVKQLSDRQLRRSLLYTQLFILLCSLMAILFSFPSWSTVQGHFEAQWGEIIVWGGGLASIILIVDILLMRFVPEEWLDDGGINERLFRGMNVGQIFFYTLLISFAEELFFRGILQTQMGLFLSSVIFALVHIRYLDKIVLFLSVVCISFLIGFVFLHTQNLWVTIMAHFIVDFILGLHLRYAKN